MACYFDSQKSSKKITSRIVSKNFAWKYCGELSAISLEESMVLYHNIIYREPLSMSAVRPLHQIFEINIHKLSRLEIYILEGELFARLYAKLQEINRKQYKEYFNLLKLDLQKEDIMLEVNFVRYMINDILDSQEYNISGIACYTNSTEDVIFDIASGRNQFPSFTLAKRILELHRVIRHQLYEAIISKIKSEIKLPNESTPSHSMKILLENNCSSSNLCSYN